MQNKLQMLWQTLLTGALIIIASTGVFAQNPFAPSLIAPEKDNKCVSKNFKFVWQEEVFSSDYQLQISRNNTFTDLVKDVNTSTTFFDVELPDFNSSYFWRVIVSYDNRSNIRKDTSEIWKFKTVLPSPVKILPEFSEARIESTVNFKWSQPESTSVYRVQICENATFAENIVKDTVLIEKNTLTWKTPKNFFTYYWRVRTEATPTCASDWSEVYSFKVAEKAPVVVSPANNAIGQELSLKLVWRAVENKQSYIVKYYNLEAGQISPIQEIHVSDLADTSYTLTGLELNKNYYWQVAAMINGSKTDWSEPQKFTTKYPQTTLLAPTPESSCISMMPEFKWNAVPTARGYSIEVSKGESFATANIVATANNVNDTTVVLALPAGVSTYFWRVKAADQKNFGDWSGVSSFVTTFAAPVQKSPVDGAKGLQRKITFKWEKLPQTVEYKFELATVRDSSGIKLYETVKRDTVNTDFVTVNVTEFNQNFAWRVGAINDINCNGMWSNFSEFTTMLGAPTLISPENNATKLDVSLDFIWSQVKDATSYEIEVAMNKRFSKDSLSHSLLAIKGTIVHLNNFKFDTKYFWRVRATNENSSSNWSEIDSFATKAQPAAKPILIAPANKATLVDLIPTFDWEKSVRAAKYQLVVASDDKFTEMLMDTTFADTNKMVSTAKLVNYNNYYWKVAAINSANELIWSDTYTFRTIAKAFEKAPNLISPANEATGLEMDVRFEWQQMPTTINYHIQVAKDKDFAEGKILNEDKKVSWNVRSLHMKDFGTEYFWRVRAINEVGEGPWSEPFKFKTFGTSNVENDIVKFNVYPNPTFDNIQVTYNSDVQQNAQLVITDASGKVIMTSMQELSADANKIDMSVRHLQQGNYFLSIQTANSGSQTIKFTVIK